MSTSAIATTLPMPDMETPFGSRARYFAACLGLLLGCAILFILELTIGSVHVPLSQVLRALTGAEVDRAAWSQIVLLFRMPRAVNAMLSGAAMGTCGLMLQTLFRNPLADPYVLGLVHGGRLGVALTVVFSGLAGATYYARYGMLGEAGLAIAAALGSALVMVCILVVSRRVSTVTLLIVGLMFGYLAQGLISVAMHFTDDAQARVFESWNDGSFGGITRSQLQILIPAVLLGLASVAALVKPLNALLLGENYARTVGLPIHRARFACFAVISLLSGVVTAFCGPVAFLGIIVAHLCRNLFGTADHRTLLPGVALMGALIALMADLVTHLPWSKHFLHLNAVNGLIGAPIVLWVVLKRKNARSLEL
jgi:iron complex transport system permease protein